MALKIFTIFLKWYFLEKPISILKETKNYIVLYHDYFSIFILIKTLFSPWKRVVERYGKGFDIQKIIETLIFNLMSRIIGAIIRIFLLIFALIIEISIIIVGLTILIIWILFPFIFFVGIYYSLFYLI